MAAAPADHTDGATRHSLTVLVSHGYRIASIAIAAIWWKMGLLTSNAGAQLLAAWLLLPVGYAKSWTAGRWRWAWFSVVGAMFISHIVLVVGAHRMGIPF